MRPDLRRGFSVALVAALAVGAPVLVFGLPRPATPSSATGTAASSSSASDSVEVIRAADASPGAAASITTPSTSVAAVQVPERTVIPGTTVPFTAGLVAQVEAAGIVPGPNWSWSMGDTRIQCAVAGSGSASGCTAWASGVEHTVFAGAPSLALVAHEVANAEVEHFAVATLLNEVSAAAGGASWSPTDAVASCLVMRFLGFEDNAAGSWQCPAVLATSVAAHIHDTIVTTQTTAICGLTSGASSTLTFTASLGMLTVTSPSGGAIPQTAMAGTPVTVSGIGTFTAKDEGGTVSVTGACEG